jgi:hypothetical protein
MKELPSTQGESSTSAVVYVFPVLSCYYSILCLSMSHYNYLYFCKWFGLLCYLNFQSVTADGPCLPNIFGTAVLHIGNFKHVKSLVTQWF